MIKIYTPENWRATFNHWPCLIIEDDGLIYSEEEYHKLLRNPIGKIDFESGYIYGEDYHKWPRYPVGLMKEENGVTKIFGEDYNKWGASPIMYIKGNQVYSADEYHKLFASASHYINSGSAQSSGSGTSSSYAGGAYGAAGYSSVGDSSESKPPSGLWKKIKIFAVCAVLVCFFLFTMYRTFAGGYGEDYALAAWGAVLASFIVALIFAKDLISAILEAEAVIVIVFWLYNAIDSIAEDGFTFGTVMGELILSPLLMIVVFAVPAVIVGSIAWGIRKLIKRLREGK